MAISNVYKPGWRSRRRSRLSLVERSVPRLGRASGLETEEKPETAAGPETEAKTEIPSALVKPSAGSQDVEPNQPDEAAEAHDAPSSFSEPEPPDQAPDAASEDAPTTQEASDLDEVDVDVELSADAEADIDAELDADADVGLEVDADLDIDVDLGADMVGPEWSEEAEEAAEEEATAEISSDSDSEIELGTDVAVVGNTSSLGEPVSQAPSTSHLVPVQNVDNDRGTDETASLPIPSKLLPADWHADDLSAAVGATAGTATIGIDWDRLISSGLVDPRDRTQPLPANMDHIARALVRQALSDQSSWRDRIILVSSAREGRAKSLAALNFAFALTTIDRHSVVLLDANMDGSGVGAHLDLAEHHGMTTALCDSTIEIDEITLDTDLDRLNLVASGGFEDDILDRFASRRMLEILRFLTKDPDTLLVLDAPPILSSQEATVLSVIAGQVVLVVEAGVTDENSINHALKRIGDRHNVSLVLSEHSGVVADDPIVEQTPQSRRLALPAPKSAKQRRRLRKAVASVALATGVGLGALLGAAEPSSEVGQSTFWIEPGVPEIGSMIR